MKKFFLLAAVLPFFFACNNQDVPSSKNIPTLPATPKADYAIKLEVPKTSTLHSELTLIEFSGEGNYTLERLEKNSDKVIVETGTYTVKELPSTNSLEFALEGKNAKLEFEKPTKATEITVKFTIDGNTITGIAMMLAQIAQNSFNQAICRSWSIEETDLSVEGSGVKFGKIYKGCDFQAIAGDLKGQGINVDPSKLTGHTVKYVEFTTGLSLKIEFTGAAPYYGDFTNFGSDGSFTYKFHGENAGNAIINAASSGSVVFNSKQQPVLMIRSKVKDETNSKEYDCTLNLTLKQYNK